MANLMPTVEMLGLELPGRDKYRAAVSDGTYVYGLPFNAPRLLRINCRTGEEEFIGPTMPAEHKYAAGALVDGFVYGLPFCATQIMRIRCSNGEVDFMGPEIQGEDKYACAVVVGKHICAPPWSAERVIRIDCSTGVVDLLGPHLDGGGKYFAAASVGGCVYAPPDRAQQVLRVDVFAGEVQLVGPVLEGFEIGYGKYMCAASVGDCIYALPYSTRRSLRVSHTTGECSLIGPELLHYGPRMYQTAAVVGQGVYGFPSDDKVSTLVARLDTITGQVERLGFGLVPPHCTYQAAVVVGKTIFGIPSDGCVLRVDVESRVAGKVRPFGPSLGKEHGFGVCSWRSSLGLYSAHSSVIAGGRIYSVPNNARRTLRISLPEPEQPRDVLSLSTPTHFSSSTASTDVQRLINRWGMDIASVLTGTHTYFPKGFVPQHTAVDCLQHVAFPGHAEVLRMATQAAAMVSEERRGCVMVIFAYTLDSPLYTQVTSSMRHTDDERLTTWREYIFHLERALIRQPCFAGTTFRGIDVLVPRSVYQPGNKITWQSFSSGTRQVLVLVQQNFIKCVDGDKLIGTVFVIRACCARCVRTISNFPAEQEVIFAPNTHFQVEEMATDEGRKRELVPDLEDYNLDKLKVFRMTEL